MIIERRWPGSTVFLLGGGPSVVGQDLCSNLIERLMDKNVLGINNAVYLPCTDVLFFGDAKWYWWNKKAVESFQGPKYTIDRGSVLDVAKGKNPTVRYEPGLTYVKYKYGAGTIFHKPVLSYNGSSGGCAISLAILMGATRLVLVGYDGKGAGSARNWMKHYKESEKDMYSCIVSRTSRVAKFLPRRWPSIKVFNANPDSEIRGFPKVSIEKALSWK